jgi:hypothetical protein
MRPDGPERPLLPFSVRAALHKPLRLRCLQAGFSRLQASCGKELRGKLLRNVFTLEENTLQKFSLRPGGF